MNNLNFKTLKKYWLRFVGIAVIAGSLVLAFAWVAGLFGHRTTSKTFLGDSLSKFDPGYRRAHGKGICFDGTYHSNGAAAALSKATVFAKSDIPAIGRFSIEVVTRMRQIIRQQQ